MIWSTLPILETQRLILRPFAITDAQDVYEYAKNPKVSESLPWNAHQSLNESKEIIERWIENYSANNTAPWAIVDKEKNKVIGTIEARHYDLKLHRIVLGYCLSQSYWGKGLMVEAVNAVTQYLFTKTDIKIIAATCRIDNPQSRRVLEKAGFVKDDTFQETIQVKNKLVAFERWVINK